METVLIAERDPQVAESAKEILEREGFHCDLAESAAEATRKASQKQYHLLITATGLPDADGFEVLRWFRKNSARTAVIMMYEGETTSCIGAAMKLGAADCVAKPFRNADEVRIRVEQIMAHRQVVDERWLLRDERRDDMFCGQVDVVYQGNTIQALDAVRMIAASDGPVLLLGENGAGKEMLARCIHQSSERREAAFAAVHCCGFSNGLLECDLFGSEAMSDGAQVGRIERAFAGTLYLDELSMLDLASQARLLRLLQEHMMERAGGVRQIPANVRIIAGSKADLQKLAAEGKFRRDLLELLGQTTIEFPPLRDRSDQIAGWAQAMLQRIAGRLGKIPPILSEDARDALSAYPWPGNLRELRFVMERAAMIAGPEVTVKDLMLPANNGSASVLKAGNGTGHWREIERKAIEEALMLHHGNRTHAAKHLGISLRKLQYRLREYGLSHPESRSAEHDDIYHSN
jgi:DNA-binding NtrC family response regulator